MRAGDGSLVCAIRGPVTLITLGVTLAFLIAHFKHQASFISGALRFDGLAVVLDMVFVVAAFAAVALSARSPAAGRNLPSALTFAVVGALTAPGICPATGSIGSCSPR